MSQLTSLLHSLISSPNFVPVVVAGAAASYAGAWGAQIAIFRRDQRREIIATINSVNEAQALCSGIGNTMMTIKRDHILGMIGKFLDAEMQYEEIRKKALGGQNQVMNIELNLTAFPAVKFPVDRIEKIVFDKLGLGMEMLAATVELVKAIDLLNSSIADRNEILAKWYDGPKVSKDEQMHRYLGTHIADRADRKYRDSLFAIAAYCDHCIYFTRVLSEAIYENGRKLRRKYRHHILWRLPNVGVPDFSVADALGLIPPRKNYERWHVGFKRRPSHWERIKQFFRRTKKLTPPEKPEA